MEHVPFVTFVGLLPWAFAAWILELLVSRGGRASDACFWGSLLGLIAPGVNALIGGGKRKAEEKRAAEQAKQDALAEEQRQKLAWEQQQNSPAAQAQRFKATMQLGRLAGAMGGTAKVPPSIAKYYQSLRTAPQWQGVPYQEPVKKGGGAWDFLGGVTDVLGNLDPSTFSKPKYNAPTKGLMSQGDYGRAAASLPTMPTGAVTDPLSGLLGRLEGPSTREANSGQGVALSSGQTINPFDPKFRRV